MSASGPSGPLVLSYPHFMLAGERAGVNKKSLCVGEPLPNFFCQCVNLVIFTSWSFQECMPFCHLLIFFSKSFFLNILQVPA